MLYDLTIIGGATAGLSAAIYAGRKKLNTVIITKEIGGQSLLTETIENFPGFESIAGRELIKKMEEQVKKYGVEIKDGLEVETITKKDDFFEIRAKGSDDFFLTRSIIIATGKNYKRLNIPGEKEFENRGVSFCSICDAPLFQGKDVAVIGGGNSGLNSALDLLKYANKIFVLEAGSYIRGDELIQEKLRESNKVDFLTNISVEEIRGENFVERIIYKDLKSSEKKELPVQGVFVNIGWEPATRFLKGFVELNNWGEIIIDHKTNQTSVLGVFAAGDCTDTLYKQCVIAAGEGAKAALAAYDYLKKSNK